MLDWRPLLELERLNLKHKLSVIWNLWWLTWTQTHWCLLKKTMQNWRRRWIHRINVSSGGFFNMQQKTSIVIQKNNGSIKFRMTWNFVIKKKHSLKQCNKSLSVTNGRYFMSISSSYKPSFKVFRKLLQNLLIILALKHVLTLIKWNFLHWNNV